jgi:hypothetical protein
VSTEAQEALATAWITAQDDLDDRARLDSVRVAADRLQAHGHPLGELVMLGLAVVECEDPSMRARLQSAHQDCVAERMPEALGSFAALMTHPRAFDMRWSLCYLDGARLPLHNARRYAGLIGHAELDPVGMLGLFLEQPAAACLRSLSVDLVRNLDCHRAVLELVARSHAPIETLVIHTSFRARREPPPLAFASEIVAALPYLHTFVFGDQLVELPGGDPSVGWTGRPSSIRALGRAATEADPARRAQALERIRRMGRNSGRYLAAIRASEPFENRRARLDAEALLRYARDASSLDRQRARFEEDGVAPRWTLRASWRALVPNGTWFAVDELEDTLREHNRLHDSPELEPLSIEAMRDDPTWIEFRRQAEALCRHLEG